MTNSEVAEAFERIADLLEIQGENPFRIRAYRRAARTIEELPESVDAMCARGADLTELPGIGEDLAGKIAEIVETGHVGLLDRLARALPGELAEMLRLPALGPKRVSALHRKLGVSTLAELESAAKAGKIRGVAGFGEKTESRILRALARRTRAETRTRIAKAEEIAAPLLDHLRGAAGVQECVVAGSFRRRCETVGDLDVLATCAQDSDVGARFTSYPEVVDVLAEGPTRCTVRLGSGIQVDLRVVPPESHGAALVYLTGSKAHNIAIRRIAIAKKLKVNEYGVFRGPKRVAGRTEAEVYAAVGLRWIAPELREDRGEIEAARRGKLPTLVTVDDVLGDLHVHTNATDGEASIGEMVAAARALGHRYLAISDHSKRLAMVHGQTAERLAAQIRAIDKLNGKLRGFTVLKSAEVDILSDGSLDLPDAILKELDFTVCSIHYGFDLGEAAQTERVLRAMDNRYFTVLGHPTGRLLGEREPYEIDMERVVRGARERGCYLEVNAQPDRLDLNDLHCRLAKDCGVKVAIVTDAHRASDLAKLRFGVDQARRGWLEPDDVLNTRPLPALRKLLRRA